MITFEIVNEKFEIKKHGFVFIFPQMVLAQAAHPAWQLAVCSTNQRLHIVEKEEMLYYKDLYYEKEPNSFAIAFRVEIFLPFHYLIKWTCKTIDRN